MVHCADSRDFHLHSRTGLIYQQKNFIREESCRSPGLLQVISAPIKLCLTASDSYRPFGLVKRHQNSDMDAESLQKSGQRTRRCLDVFLVVSIIFLFSALAAVVAGGVFYVRHIQSELDSPRRPVEPGQLARQTGDAPDQGYKMQNFAYLEARSSLLQTSTMPLDKVFYGLSSSVGSNFEFDKSVYSLTPLKEGTYFLYINLNLTCTGRCDPGLLTVSLGDKLTCEVNLPSLSDSTHVSRKCWTVEHLKPEKLVAQMTVQEGGLTDWKLVLKSSGIGMFHVD